MGEYLKKCAKCSELKSGEGYHKSARAADGLQSYCKTCKTESKREYRERLRERAEEQREAATVGLDAFEITGVSSLVKFGPDGEETIAAQWVKTGKTKTKRLEELSKAIEGLAEPLRGCVIPTDAPKHLDSDLLATYPMGDPHVGLYCWAEETGSDFNLDICTQNIQKAMAQTVDNAPNAERALFVLLGDTFHSDNQSNRTARSGNALDVDTRWAKVLREAIRTFRWCIDELLSKHAQVDVIVAIGNHDDHSSVMLAIALQLAYENEPRVCVHDTVSKFHYYRFGKCLFGVTHGDTAKPKDLPLIMANDRPEDWGAALYRHWMTGHVHHESHKDFTACSVETFRVLAPGDAWHVGAGYRASRDMRCDVWHRDFGLVTRHITGINLIEAMEDKEQ